MTHRLAFDSAFDGATTRMRLLSDFGAGVVENHWLGLFQPYGSENNPFYRHAVNNNNTEEVAVYLGLAAALTDGPLQRWVLPAGETEHLVHSSIEVELNQIRWDYRVGADETDWDRRGGRFERALYPVESPEPAAWRGRPASVYRAVSHRDLLPAMQWGLGDVWAQLLVFGVNGDRGAQRLVERLRSRAEPTLPDLMDDGEVVVAVTVGVDFGYYDSVEIVARGDHRVEVERPWTPSAHGSTTTRAESAGWQP